MPKTQEFPLSGRAAQARSASRWIEPETVRKHGTGLRSFIRGAERSRYIPHHARARNPKPLVLAAFFGYFLSLLTESTPPETFAGKKILSRTNPSTNLRLVPLPLGKGGNGFTEVRYGGPM